MGLVILAVACKRGGDGRRAYAFQGPTMGTTFVVKVVADGLSQERQLQIQDLIGIRLEDINSKMSTYLPDSELSRFNRSRDTTPFPVSEETFQVFRQALELGVLTDGALDITVGPLVNAWGFGPVEQAPTVPSDEHIIDLLDRVGYTKLELDPDGPAIRKTEPLLYCDLSAVAKGYAVDRVAEALEAEGIFEYMVEVGGEVRTSGENDAGTAWRIAIERPVPGRRTVQRIIPLSGLAMATSGGYRNFYEVDGVRISHTIDPRNGRPIAHELAAVTVADKTCVRADGLATGLLVLGPDEGYDRAVALELAALFIIADESDRFREKATPAFERLIRQ
jgi:thiamine biosynthesis lipoprotein